jgi:hypothetical protein
LLLGISFRCRIWWSPAGWLFFFLSSKVFMNERGVGKVHIITHDRWVFSSIIEVILQCGLPPAMFVGGFNPSEKY